MVALGLSSRARAPRRGIGPALAAVGLHAAPYLEGSSRVKNPISDDGARAVAECVQKCPKHPGRPAGPAHRHHARTVPPAVLRAIMGLEHGDETRWPDLLDVVGDVLKNRRPVSPLSRPRAAGAATAAPHPALSAGNGGDSRGETLIGQRAATSPRRCRRRRRPAGEARARTGAHARRRGRSRRRGPAARSGRRACRPGRSGATR